MSEDKGLPKGWAETPLPLIAEINPSRGTITNPLESPVHFVPMASVSEEFGGIDVSTFRPLSEVQKGYTAFREDDVLFAKITPCMENGKLAVVPRLDYGVGFGSTEFHVLRPTLAVTPRWIGHFLSQSGVRRNARRNMTGSAGQLRVPTVWLNDQVLPLPPLPEQHRIVEKIEELFSDLDAGVASLQRAKANLKRYRASVLKSAVEGRLTEEWRNEHPQAEDGQMLLDRILRERREKWEKDQLLKFKEKGKEPPKNWESKYEEPSAPDTSDLPELPEGWVWASLEAVSDVTGGITKDKKKDSLPGLREVPYLRVANVQRGFLDLSEMKTIKASPEDIQELALCRGDVLFTEGGDRDKLGRGWVWSEELPECIHQNHIFRARLSSSGIQPSLVSHHGNTFGRQWFTKAGKQTTNLASINLGILKRFPVPLPPPAEQEQIVSLVEERLSQIDSAEKTIDAELIRAKRLRQSILKIAFEGKLVPQDPKDEPASVLLERIKATREAEQPKKKARKATKGKAKS
ncbi:MAG: restriction endonuclease subunit S [Planctomycetia bacterium]|nr:restriction endonuclease subunit S [Planctomycetia bacterium]